MDLNKIKLLKKNELLQKLKQSGFSDVVTILEDKEINGEKFIELKEFEIFKWKLSPDEKKRLWKCISEIKAKPFLLVAKGKPKLVKRPSVQRVGSFSETKNETKLFKGKLEGLLGSAGASVGSASTLPNRNHQNIEATLTLPHRHTNVNTIERDEGGTIRHKPPAPPPPPIPGVDQTNKMSRQPGNIKKPAIPVPSKGWQTQVVKKAALPLPSENANDDEYIEMQQPTEVNKKTQPDDEYLTPREIEENDYEAPPNITELNRSHIRNMNFPAKVDTSVKKVGIPAAPPLPNKIAKSSTKNIHRFDNNSFASSEEGTSQRTSKILNSLNLPRPPPSPRSVSPTNRISNSSAGLNRQELPLSGGKVTSNKYLVEVITAEPEEENNYDNVDSERELKTNQNMGYRHIPRTDSFHQSVPSKITPEKARREQVIPSNNETSEQSQILSTRKTTVQDLENVLIVNDRESGLSKISSALTSIFKKNKLKNSYENHSIVSETRAIRAISIKERPLPEIPPFVISEMVEEKPLNRPTSIIERPLPVLPSDVTSEALEENPSDRFAKPFPLPRENIPFSDPAESYVELTRNIPNQLLQLSTRTTEKSLETPQKENVGIPSKTKSGDNTLDNEEELPEYGNTVNSSNQTQQVSIQDQLASLLAQKLKERNYRINGKKMSKSSEDDSDSEFEEDPSYGNVEEIINSSGSNLKIPNPIVNNPSVHSSYKHTSPTPIVFNNSQETHDDEDPSYGNVDDSINTFRPIQFPLKNVTPVPPSASIFSNKSKLPTRIPFNNPPEVHDDEDPSYGNVDDSINTLRPIQFPLKNISPVPPSSSIFSNKSKSSTPIPFNNPPEVHDDEDPSYGNVDDSINTFRPIQFPLKSVPSIPISSSLFSNKSKSPTRIASINPPEVHDDEDPNYDNVENSINAFKQKQFPLKNVPPVLPSSYTHGENNGSNRKGKSIPIFKRPLPEIPKSNNKASNKSAIAGKQVPISNRDLHTPPTSDEELNDDENLTYGNIEPEPNIRKPPAVIGNKTLIVNKKQEDEIFRRSLPKPPTGGRGRFNYERYKGQVGGDERTKIFNEPEEEEVADHTKTNLNEEPFFRNTDRKGAKALLRNLEDGAFLIRPGETYPLALTVKYRNKYYNLGIERNSVGRIRLHAEQDSLSPEFSSLHDFVDYFVKKPVTFQDKNAVVEICLKPVLPQNLF